MRVLPAAIAVSLVGHGAAVAWIAERPRTMPHAIVATAQPQRRAETRMPIAVVVLDSPHELHAATGRSGRTAIAAEPTPHAEAPPPPTPTPDLGLHGAFVEHFLERPPPAPAPTPEPEAPVLLDDQINELSAMLHDPSWHGDKGVARHRLNMLIEASERAELQRDGSGYRAEHLAFTGHVDADGIAHLEDKPADLEDAIMRAHHIDPYSANKLAFLDRTRDERYAIGKRHQRKLLARSGQLALDALHAIWNETSNVAERKQAVFELWDDCAETGDAELVAGGRDARAMIVEFVQTHLTGRDAYTPDELAAFNAHKASAAPFAPYAP